MWVELGFYGQVVVKFALCSKQIYANLNTPNCTLIVHLTRYLKWITLWSVLYQKQKDFRLYR